MPTSQRLTIASSSTQQSDSSPPSTVLSIRPDSSSSDDTGAAGRLSLVIPLQQPTPSVSPTRTPQRTEIQRPPVLIGHQGIRKPYKRRQHIHARQVKQFCSKRSSFLMPYLCSTRRLSKRNLRWSFIIWNDRKVSS